jgi:L-galactose dehydrogenase
MQYRTLGRTGLKVSLLSLGTGGPSKLGQETGLEQRDQTALVRRALDLGVNLFDTSVGYGESESILGRAFEDVPRDTYMLATKWRYQPEEGRVADPAELIASVERSLRRLGTDHIDIMQFHGILVEEYAEVIESLYSAMTQLREDGKIRFMGFSEQFSRDPAHETPVLALNESLGLWDTIMLKYGILNQYADKEVLPMAMEQGIGIINMAAVRVKLPDPDLLVGLIAEWKARGDVPADALPDSAPLGWLLRDGISSVIEAGYKFAADHPAIATVLTGTASIAHLEANAAALDEPRLPEEDNVKLRQLFGHIAEYA